MTFGHCISFLDSGLRTVIFNVHTFSQVYLYLQWTPYKLNLR